MDLYLDGYYPSIIEYLSSLDIEKTDSIIISHGRQVITYVTLDNLNRYDNKSKQMSNT